MSFFSCSRFCLIRISFALFRSFIQFLRFFGFDLSFNFSSFFTGYSRFPSPWFVLWKPCVRLCKPSSLLWKGNPLRPLWALRCFDWMGSSSGFSWLSATVVAASWSFREIPCKVNMLKLHWYDMVRENSWPKCQSVQEGDNTWNMPSPPCDWLIIAIHSAWFLWMHSFPTKEQ